MDHSRFRLIRGKLCVAHSICEKLLSQPLTGGVHHHSRSLDTIEKKLSAMEDLVAELADDENRFVDEFAVWKDKLAQLWEQFCEISNRSSSSNSNSNSYSSNCGGRSGGSESITRSVVTIPSQPIDGANDHDTSVDDEMFPLNASSSSIMSQMDLKAIRVELERSLRSLPAICSATDFASIESVANAISAVYYRLRSNRLLAGRLLHRDLLEIAIEKLPESLRAKLSELDDAPITLETLSDFLRDQLRLCTETDNQQQQHRISVFSPKPEHAHFRSYHAAANRGKHFDTQKSSNVESFKRRISSSPDNHQARSSSPSSSSSSSQSIGKQISFSNKYSGDRSGNRGQSFGEKGMRGGGGGRGGGRSSYRGDHHQNQYNHNRGRRGRSFSSSAVPHRSTESNIHDADDNDNNGNPGSRNRNRNETSSGGDQPDLMDLSDFDWTKPIIAAKKPKEESTSAAAAAATRKRSVASASIDEDDNEKVTKKITNKKDDDHLAGKAKKEKTSTVESEIRSDDLSSKPEKAQEIDKQNVMKKVNEDENDDDDDDDVDRNLPEKESKPEIATTTGNSVKEITDTGVPQSTPSTESSKNDLIVSDAIAQDSK